MLFPAHPRYSYNWANSVVGTLLAKHARGGKTVLEWLAISPQELARFLAHGDSLWPALRDLLKIVDSWENTPNFPGWNKEMCQHLWDFKKNKLPERLAKRLDRGCFGAKLEEQGIREGSRGAQATIDPSFPLGLGGSREERQVEVEHS